MISAEEAADIIARGIRDGERMIAFPWQMKALLGTASLLPEPIVKKGLKKLL
jgi:hypothetical protein